METGTEIAKPQDHRPEWYENLSLEDAEAFIRARLRSAARDVIAVGYFLKNIRDNQLYQEAGYGNIWDYAAGQFGFSRSTASRYMARNDKFSKGGNSPIIDERYQDFSKSQLQEMLSLDEEQLEQVTPDMTVKQIRELRTPKEIPYFPIEGQMNLEDFPEIIPEERKESVRIPEEILTLEELAGEDPEGGMPEAEPAGEVCATSQQEECFEIGREDPENVVEDVVERLSAYGTPKRVYPPDSLLAVEGCEGGPHDCFSCAMDCPIRGKDRYCREATTGNPFPCEIVQYGFTGLPKTCQFVDHDLAFHRVGDGEAVPCCKNCEEPCEYICGRAMKALDQQEKVAEEQEEEDEDKLLCDDCKNASSLTGNVDLCASCRDGRHYESVLPDGQEEISDMDLLRNMLEKENDALGEMLKANKAEPHPDLETMIRKKRLLVGALANMLCDLENVTGPESPGQPDLPVMKNNDQRKAFLETYHDWPVWFEVPQAAEVYYRYDLPDGSSLVICEYHYWLDWMDRYGDGPDRTGTREYLLTPGYHYLQDCKTNRTAMIERLKEDRKRGDPR